jgi:hypothetical protein
MGIERDQEIRELAYGIWQQEGCPQGYEVQQWLKAETIWQEEQRPREPEYSKRKKGQSNRNRRKTVVIPRP